MMGHAQGQATVRARFNVDTYRPGSGAVVSGSISTTLRHFPCLADQRTGGGVGRLRPRQDAASIDQIGEWVSQHRAEVVRAAGWRSQRRLPRCVVQPPRALKNASQYL